MTDQEWFELVRDGADEGWKAVWERVVEPESRSGRSAGTSYGNNGHLRGCTLFNSFPEQYSYLQVNKSHNQLPSS